eukprot:Pompholyxophrys_punicea_v1_NODE_734_length_1379_cov_4.425982.p1 type:complete len:303 gc:universal NODE_734_length_1379_cov_4.425982:405-1313(+)
METEGHCYHFVTTTLTNSGYVIPELIFSVIEFASFLLILFLLYRDARLARTGHQTASERLVLPVYVWFLYILATIVLVQSLCNAGLDFSLLPIADNDLDVSIIFAILYGLNRYVYDGLTLFLIQEGAGFIAISRAAIFAIFFAICSMVVNFFLFYRDSPAEDSVLVVLDLVYQTAYLIFFLILLFAPVSFLYRRPALKNYNIYWFVFQSLSLISSILVWNEDDIGYCVYYINLWVISGVCKPFLFYYTLLRDSQYWQGIYFENPELSWVTWLRLKFYSSGNFFSLCTSFTTRRDFEVAHLRY